MESTIPTANVVNIASSEDEDSDMDISAGDVYPEVQTFEKNITPVHTDEKETIPEGLLLMQSAKMYQDFMKVIPIPTVRGSVIPFLSWYGLGKSIKQIYKQPLHYLTNIYLKQLDESRVGVENEYEPLDFIIHPVKAEATIWLMEETHRLNTSHHYLFQLWGKDERYSSYIDDIVPDMSSLK